MYMRVIGEQNTVGNKVFSISYGLTNLLFLITLSVVKKKKKIVNMKSFYFVPFCSLWVIMTYAKF